MAFSSNVPRDVIVVVKHEVSSGKPSDTIVSMEGNSRQTSTNNDLGLEGGHPRSDVSVRHLKVDGWEMRDGPQVKWAETLRITEVLLEMMSKPPQIRQTPLRILKCLKDCHETLQDD